MFTRTLEPGWYVISWSEHQRSCGQSLDVPDPEESVVWRDKRRRGMSVAEFVARTSRETLNLRLSSLRIFLPAVISALGLCDRSISSSRSLCSSACGRPTASRGSHRRLRSSSLILGRPPVADLARPHTASQSQACLRPLAAYRIFELDLASH